MLDYTKQNKKFLSVKLADETQLFLSVPKKELYTKLSGLEKTLNNITDIEEIYDELLDLTAEILTNNKAKTVISSETVNEIMDIEDMALLIREYSKFAGQIVKSPN